MASRNPIGEAQRKMAYRDKSAPEKLQQLEDELRQLLEDSELPTAVRHQITQTLAKLALDLNSLTGRVEPTSKVAALQELRLKAVKGGKG